MDKLDFKFYYNFYPDLQKNNINTHKKLLEHYNIYGKNENRVKNKLELLDRYKFNADIYRYNYEDLHSLSKTELENHFIDYGMNEERVVDKYLIKIVRDVEFQVDYYKNNNPDLQHMTSLELYSHFNSFGYQENKKYFIEKESPKIINILSSPKFENLSLLEFKNKHREICRDELPIIKNIKINSNIKYLDRETIFIEFRILPNIEFLIRNMMIKLPDWKHSVVCGKNNFNYIKELCSQISEDINIIILSDIENLTPSQYSRLLTSVNFWNNFSGEKLLIYQEDSMIFHSQIDKFLEYDYIGAPWPNNQDDNKYGVGNGGFTLRSKSVLIKCLEKIKPENLKYGNSTLEYMKNNNSEYFPEDVYFSKTIIDFNLGKVAPREVAIQFSQETQKSIKPLGGHQYWIAENKITLPYVKRYNLFDNYYLGVTHRGGWKNVIQNLVNNNIAITENFIDNNISLIDCCESFFLWNTIYEKVNIGKWVGIIHFCPNIPNFLNGENLDSLLNNDKFLKCIPTCICIIVLSDYLKKYIQNKFPELKIQVLKHPIEDIETKFDVENFHKNPNKYLIHLGYQSRIISSIFRVKTSFNKIILTGRKYNSEIILSRIQKELNYLDIKNIDVKISDIKLKYFDNNEDYDEFLTQNICIIPLWDASANNSILEIISMNIPTFVTKLEPTIFYLGEKYPMFFNDINEINDMLNDSNKFNILIIKTYNYLKNMNKENLSLHNFNSEILRIIN